MKISIIGTGRVGSAVAFALVSRGTPRELVLVGRDKTRAEGEAADLQHASAFVRPMRVIAGDYDATSNSDIVILTASAKAPPSSSRLDEAPYNATLFREIVPVISMRSPNAILIVVTNPVDVMTHLALKLSGFHPSKVMGTGTLIDTGRFRATLCERWKINAHDVRAYILGEHGDSQFPALSVASAGGVKLQADDSFVVEAAELARRGGFLVYTQKGYTNFAVAMACSMIVNAIVEDSREVLPLSCLIEGYLGVNDVCLSVPVVVGRNGITRMLPIDLNASEVALFKHSAETMKKVISRLEEEPIQN